MLWGRGRWAFFPAHVLRGQGFRVADVAHAADAAAHALNWQAELGPRLHDWSAEYVHTSLHRAHSPSHSHNLHFLAAG